MLLVSLLLVSLIKCDIFVDFVLDKFYTPNDKRRSTFKLALELMKNRNSTIIFETGTSRHGKSNCGGDGCSTVLFSYWAARNPRTYVFSVDIDKDNVQSAIKAVEEYGTTFVIEGDSVETLRGFFEPIDFLYLDSYDFSVADPNPSQEHHLKEISAGYKNLHQKSFVMVDDCSFPYGGKCALVEKYLTDLGWFVLVLEYQMIMTPGPKTLLPTRQSFTNSIYI